MAEEVLVKETLSPEMIEAGKALTKRLDELGWPLVGSLWFYNPESNQWRLILASPRTESEGPRKTYQEIQGALKALPAGSPSISLSDVTVVEPSNPLIALLRSVIKTGPNVSDIRFSRNTVNGQFIEDAFIYRLV